MPLSSSQMLRRFCCFGAAASSPSTITESSSAALNSHKKRLVFLGSPQDRSKLLIRELPQYLMVQLKLKHLPRTSLKLHWLLKYKFEEPFISFCVKEAKEIEMGALDYLSNFCTVTSTRGKRKPMQTVEIKVKMDCDGCERRVKNAVKNMRVKTVEVNRKQNRVTVSGFIDPNKVLKRVKNTGKMAEFWPYIPYNLVQYPYISQAYDKRAPAGFVRNLVQAATVPVPNATHEEERITYLFRS